MITARNFTVFPSSAFMPCGSLELKYRLSPSFKINSLPSMLDHHTAFQYEVELLTGMAVVMYRLVVWFRFNGDDERIGRSVDESCSQWDWYLYALVRSILIPFPARVRKITVILGSCPNIRASRDYTIRAGYLL